MTAGGIRVLIADDHALIREGLKRILLDGNVARHVGEVRSAAEAIAAVQSDTWDLAILDINLDGASGLDVLKDLKARRPRLPVLMLSMYSEEQFAMRAMRAGASGYLSKNQASQTLVHAIQEVLRGGQYISDKVATELLHAVRHPRDGAAHSMLSDREDQVLRLIASGQTVGEIAERLTLSVKTVSTYRAKVLQKLGLRNNAQLMRYAQEHGLND